MQKDTKQKTYMHDVLEELPMRETTIDYRERWIAEANRAELLTWWRDTLSMERDALKAQRDGLLNALIELSREATEGKIKAKTLQAAFDAIANATKEPS